MPFARAPPTRRRGILFGIALLLFYRERLGMWPSRLFSAPRAPQCPLTACFHWYQQATMTLLLSSKTLKKGEGIGSRGPTSPQVGISPNCFSNETDALGARTLESAFGSPRVQVNADISVSRLQPFSHTETIFPKRVTCPNWLFAARRCLR